MKHTTSIPMASMSMSNTPAVWEASTTSSRPCSLAKRPMARISSRFPVRLEPWVQMMPRVLGRSRRRKSS